MPEEFVAVPGGAGFIGSHLCERLVAAGHRVLALDDLSTGDARHLEALRGHPRFALVQVAQVPEPHVFALLGLGLAIGALSRRWRAPGVVADSAFSPEVSQT